MASVQPPSFEAVAQLLNEPTSFARMDSLLEATSKDQASRLALLSLVFPQLERRFVYHRKTKRLLQLWGDTFQTLAKLKSLKPPVSLNEWLASPTAETQVRGEHIEIISKPEALVAQVFAAGAKGNSSFSSVVRHNALAEIQRLREVLSTKDNEREQQAASNAVLLKLSAVESQALFTILLRSVSTRVPLSRVHPQAQAFLRHQNDIERLAAWSMRPDNAYHIEWGVPSKPMLCKNAGHYDLLPWLFAEDADTELKAIPPIEVELAIPEEGKWMVKVRRGRDKNFFDMTAQPMASHRAHIIALRAFKATGLLNEAMLKGCVVRYRLFKALSPKQFVMMLYSVRALDSEMDMSTGLERIITDSETVSVPSVEEAILLSVVDANGCTYKIVSEEEPTQKVEKTGKVLVQTKYDGDRLQAHIDKGKVLLFTKNGYNMTEHYSDVAKELAIATSKRCILDGELIVVDASGNPMPWQDGKWKYNTGAEQPTENSDQIFLFTGTEGEMDEENDMTILPPRQKKIPKLLEDTAGVTLRAKLMYVVFDILMCDGESMMNKGYGDRWNALKKLLRGRYTHIMLAPTTECLTAKDIEKQLVKSVKEKTEGLILKNPQGRVQPGERSNNVQKLKVTGPEINTLVVGAGFNLSGNPHQWGILTALKAPGGGQTYVRVQSFDGDRQSRIMRHVLQLPSRVQVSDLRNTGTVLSKGQQEVQVTLLEGGALTVAWANFTLHVQDKAQLQDVQWLVNPSDCLFGLSVRGDLRPLDAYHMPYLRFPVGRVEFALMEQSEPDTPAQALEKFEQAQKLDTCMQSFTRRYTNKLRSRPTTDKMKRLSRLAYAFTHPTTAATKLAQKYPSEVVKTFVEKMQAPELTMEEERVLEGRVPTSQWSELATSAEEKEALIATREKERVSYAEVHKERLRETLQSLQNRLGASSWGFVTTNSAFTCESSDSDA